MAKALYRNTGTNQMVWVPVGFFDGNPLWELVDGGGAGGEVTQAELDALEADTTGPHGVDDFSELETQDGATHKVADGILDHSGASDPHGDRADTTAKIGIHSAAVDPHADRAFATSSIDTHSADTTGVHGRSDMLQLETLTGAQGKVDTHAAAVDPHADRAFTTSSIGTHAGAADPHADRGWVTGQVGAANGIASLDSGTKLPHAQLPVIDGADIASGTVAYARLPVGTTASTVAAGDVTTTALAGKVGKGELVLNVKDFGAVGDGSTNDTTAIGDALAAANALVRSGIVGTIKHPGATVLFPAGVYSLTGLASPITVTCNVRSNGATLLVPAGYAGTALLVGHPTAGSILQSANIELPDVVKPTNSLIVAGSVGVQVQNLYSSRLTFGRVSNFEIGQWHTGLGEGNVYNEVNIGWIGYCKVSMQLKPSAGGWVNQNTYVGGGIQQSSGFAGGSRLSGWRHLVLDGAAINAVNGCTFVGVSFEGNVSEYVVYAKAAYQNTWIGCRYETGAFYSTAVTVSGATLTATAHGLATGDLILLTASSVPGGMTVPSPYYVVATPTADTFNIARNKGGSAVTFTSAGSGVLMARPPRIYFDTAGTGVSDNVIREPCIPLGYLDVVHSTAIAGGNVVQTGGSYSVHDRWSPEDLPLVRARNANTVDATVRPLIAAYGTGSNPTEAPDAWSTALSDRGVIWKAGQIIRTGTGSPEGAVTAPVASLFLRTDGAGAATVYSKESGSGNTGWNALVRSPDVQTFTSSGTYTKPAGAKLVEVVMIGGGGGGAAGRRGAAGTVRCGGGGGSGGAIIRMTFPAASVGATETVTVGAGGAGAAAQTADNTNGANGSAAGVDTTFGGLVRAFGGGAGFGGSATAGTGASATSGSGGVGAGAGASGAGGVGGSVGQGGPAAAQGGAAGGGITSADFAAPGGAWNYYSSTPPYVGGAGGVVDTTPPGSGSNATAGLPMPGTSAGGGAASITTNAQTGGNGGAYGCGGGGGGASLNGNNSGGGGAGGAGIAVVTTYF